MDNTAKKERTEELKLKVLQGGKSNPPGHDWLSELPKGTAFSSRSQNSKSYLLEIFIVASKHSKMTLLVDGLNAQSRYPVDSKLFSQQNTLIEILGFEDGSDPVHTSGVDNDVDAPGRQQIDGGEGSE